MGEIKKGISNYDAQLRKYHLPGNQSVQHKSGSMFRMRNAVIRDIKYLPPARMMLMRIEHWYFPDFSVHIYISYDFSVRTNARISVK